MKNYLTEFIGTFFLVLVIGLVTSQPLPVINNSLLAPFAIGSILMVMVYMGGNISGAHYNPAVTLAVMMRKKISGAEAIGYMISQLCGALAAAITFYIIFKLTMSPVTPVSGFQYNIKPMLLEMLFTFALASVVLNVATTKKAAGNSYYGLSIGFTVAAAAAAAGPYSGGSFNPAVTLGPMMMDTVMGGSSLGNAWFYLIGQFGGAAIAAFLFSKMNPDEA